MSRFNLSSVGLVAVFCFSLAAVAQAETINIPVPYGDFSSPTAPASPGYIYGVTPTGWTGTKPSTSFVALGGPSGTSQLFGQDATFSDSRVGLYQYDTGVPWVAGDTYTLSFGYASGHSEHGHTLVAELVYDTGANSLASQSFSVPKCGATVNWAEGSVSGLATSSMTGNIGIAFTFMTTTGGLEALMGHVTLTQTSPIPEPGTVVLLATGVFGLLAYAWRRRK